MQHFTRRLLNPFFFICAALLISAVYLLSALVAEGATTATSPSATATTKTVAQLQAKYVAAAKGGPKVKVLIVPGHESDYGGAEYLTLKERDISVAIANQLALELRKDPRLTVVVTRDTQSWNTALTTYFADDWTRIQDFINAHKLLFGTLAGSTFQENHNAAPTDVATRLYGITKWADENGVDMAIHIHLNDAADHTTTTPGNQSGFAVYVPDSSYGNAITSKPLGSAIASELNHYNATSTLGIENQGVAADQELIALGAYNTAAYPSVLIEYAYIYESKITNPTILPIVEKEFANSTYRGIKKFFKAKLSYYDTLTLPHKFTTSPVVNSTTAETYTLQVALHRVGMYPPAGELFFDCPVSGIMNNCTVDAIKQFQKSKGLEQTGALGPKTLAALNAIWAP